ncbi:HmuY family protein [Dyadobacter sp. CY345]|uniref:HmuY family protein n=1 Tax=Dyadobacter sp. CY345 TaxID=2909335 RepID=UPI001F46E179|nr:HmuY family protein [Dyadobacter sp. CY345]MCF2442438.1 HmuY family protein [Dyadobacter sp. CY345]
MFKSIIFSVSLFINTDVPKTSFDSDFEANFEIISSLATPEVRVIKDFIAAAKPNTYHYFSLVAGTEILSEDAKTTKWDLAFSGTTILVNGGTSGSGKGAALILEKPFDTVTEAPKDGYKTDDGSGNAIASGSGNSWYKYDMNVHAILPITGRTIVVKTAEGKFAKIEFISYYKGAPEDVPTEESKYYTFRYVLADENGKF